MPAPKSETKTETNKGPFRIALNPRNPEANSWFDPSTGINLFLSSPVSHDLSNYSTEELRAVTRGLRAGLLIVSHGAPPEDMDLTEARSFAAPRTRWSADDSNMSEEESKKKHLELNDAATHAMNNHHRVLDKAQKNKLEAKTETN